MTGNTPIKRDASKGVSPLSPYRPPPMRPALRQALQLIAEQGRTQRDAAAKVGMNEKSLSRAILRPEIAAHLEHLKAIFAMDADTLKGSARAMAYRVGIELLHDAKSEAVRARMVELFTGEGKGPGVVVQVNQASPAYTYTRPTDHTSGAQEVQGVVINGQSVDVDGKD